MKHNEPLSNEQLRNIEFFVKSAIEEIIDGDDYKVTVIRVTPSSTNPHIETIDAEAIPL